MPNKEEIRKIMEKARKAASGGKGTPEEKPKPETKEKPPVQKKEPSAPLPKEEKPKPQVPPPDPQTLALKSSIDRLTDVVGKLEARLTNTETKTEVINPSGETGKTEGATQEELTPEQELAMLQEAQRAQQAGQGQGQVPAGPGNPLYVYLLGKTLDTVGKVLPAALQRGGGGGGEGKPTLSSLAEEWLIAQIKNQIMGGGGGGNNAITLDQLRAFTDAQKVLAAGIFDTIKGLPKPTGQQALERLVGTHEPEGSPSEGHIV